MSPPQQNSGIRQGRQEDGLVPLPDSRDTHGLAVPH